MLESLKHRICIAMTEFDLATTPRPQATGKAREGVNPSQGLGTEVLYCGFTRPEAKGLGRF